MIGCLVKAAVFLAGWAVAACFAAYLVFHPAVAVHLNHDMRGYLTAVRTALRVI